MEILIGGWFLCGLIAAVIGSSKGEGCVGFLFGALLGPLGILIVILSSGNKVACFYCKTKIDRSALQCPFCRNYGPGAKAAMEKGWPGLGGPGPR